jgi:hypothetical protein
MGQKETQQGGMKNGKDQNGTVPPKQHTDHSYSTSHGFDDKADKLVYEKT